MSKEEKGKIIDFEKKAEERNRRNKRRDLDAEIGQVLGNYPNPEEIIKTAIEEREVFDPEKDYKEFVNFIKSSLGKSIADL